MGRPWGIAFGKNGMWAVADWSNHCVYIFDGENQLVRKFGCKGSGNYQFNHPTGVAFDNDDHLYVADNNRIQKFNIDGEYMLKFGSQGSVYEHPEGLTVHNDKVYISDFSFVKGCISVFQTDGVFLHTVGSGQLGSPRDVAVDGNNQLLVADWRRVCIHTFILDGDYVGKFGTRGTGAGHLDDAHCVAVDLYGFILVADTDNHCVSIFDKNGNYINCFGSEGSAIGQFQRPFGIAVSANGNIYVSDHDNKRIQIFSY